MPTLALADAYRAQGGEGHSFGVHVYLPRQEAILDLQVNFYRFRKVHWCLGWRQVSTNFILGHAGVIVKDSYLPRSSATWEEAKRSIQVILNL